MIKLLPHNIIKKKFNDCFLLSFLFIEKTIEKKINGNCVFKIDFLRRKLQQITRIEEMAIISQLNLLQALW